MALHRDIYWVGRQWAVTAAGIQAVDQKRRSEFDIKVARLWDDGLAEPMLALDWFNGEDFDKALAIARSRFPEPPRKPLPLVESVLGLIQPSPTDGPKPASPPLESTPQLGEPAPAKPPEPAPPILQLRTEGALARFLPQWRVRR
jgi:hypothetical protein